jgi:hypothetical protein
VSNRYAIVNFNCKEKFKKIPSKKSTLKDVKEEIKK